MSNKLPETGGPEEVDLGQLFKLIGNAFERFYKFLSEVLNKLLLSLVWLVFFLKKNFLKIFLAGIIGFAIAFVKEKISGPVFVSSVTVTQNYGTGENLYDLVDYYNSLTKQKDSITIAKTFGLSESDGNNFVSFEIEPVVSENSRIKNYDAYIKGLDSAIAASIDYETYLDNTMKHDYRQQKISIKTKESRNLLPIFEKIIDKVSLSEFFNTRQKRDIEELKNRELALKQAIVESDSLKNTYKRVLEMPIDKKGRESGTNITIEGSETKNKTKEFELYQNDLQLRRELVAIERQKQDKEEIIEIVSSEFTSGTVDNKTTILGKEISRKIAYAMIFSLIAFFFIIMLETNKFLDRYKEKF